MTLLAPELLLDASGARRDTAVAIEDGRIARLVTPVPPEAERLAGIALLPGFVDAHSHAFQRALRGRAERAGGDFWGWREAMYAEAGTLDPETLFERARACFAALRASGYVAVGEFHYVHHHPDGTPYAEPNALAQALCEAAEVAGVRVCLLLAFYERAGAGRPPEPGQRRFCDASVEAFLERVDALRAWAEPRPLVSVGVAAHSVRAVSAPALERLAAHARAHALPFHVHAGEQTREVEECLAEHGVRPIELLERCGALGPTTTVVHATQADARERELLAASETTVCACPTTEANLGDGCVPSELLVSAGVPLAIGSDSNARLDPFEELRELELCARRRTLRRTVLPFESVLAAGWEHGAAALGLPAPTFAAGAPADLVAIDLTREPLAGVADDDLLAALVFSGSAALVSRTWVAGR